MSRSMNPQLIGGGLGARAAAEFIGSCDMCCVASSQLAEEDTLHSASRPAEYELAWSLGNLPGCSFFSIGIAGTLVLCMLPRLCSFISLTRDHLPAVGNWRYPNGRTQPMAQQEQELPLSHKSTNSFPMYSASFALRSAATVPVRQFSTWVPCVHAPYRAGRGRREFWSN